MRRKSPWNCPVCTDPLKRHLVGGSLCRIKFCTWATCVPCGVIKDMQTGRVIRTGVI